MRRAAELLLAFVALYPVVTAAVWIAGGVLFRLFDERREAHVPDGGWPGVTVLIPAYNEEQVIAMSVRAALDADYPELEVLVLDDGSADGTAAAARAAAAGDPRCEVLRDPVNRGKAEQLNTGFARARHELVVVTDADTHMMPHAVRRLAARMDQSPLVAAVAGAPHVTNRTRLICAMQVLEAASIIGLVRRTQSLSGRVGIVAGVLGMFRRERVLAVGGYDARMSTEDIDLTWRLLMAGWHTAYEPYALVGMQVPSTAAGAVGTAHALGARPGRDPARASAHDLCLAQPPDVDPRPRVGRVAGVGDGVGAGPRLQRPVRLHASVCSASAWRGASPSPLWPPCSLSSRWRLASRTTTSTSARSCSRRRTCCCSGSCRRARRYARRSWRPSVGRMSPARCGTRRASSSTPSAQPANEQMVRPCWPPWPASP